MARRNGPQTSQPMLAGRQAPPHTEEPSLLGALREQLFAPEKLPGNVSLLTGVAVFLGGIAAVRTWGELMVPA